MSKSLHSKLSYILISIYVILILTGVFLPLIFAPIYKDLKLNSLNDYISTTQDTPIQIIDYLKGEGYTLEIYTSSEEELRSSEVIDYQFNDDSMTLSFSNGTSALIGYNDDLIFKYTFSFMILSTVISTTIFIIFYYYLNRIKYYISQDLAIIEKQITSHEYDTNTYFMEFNSITDSCKQMHEKKTYELEHKKVLVRTLNHELKSPINTIDSLVQANIKQMDGYENLNDYTYDILTNLSKLQELISYSNIIMFPNSMENQVSFNEIITTILKAKQIDIDNCLLYCRLTTDGNFTHNIEDKVANFIVSNLIINIIKHSELDTDFYIDIKDEVITFKNVIKINDEEPGVGFYLIEQIANQNNLELKVKITDGYYVVQLIKK